MISFFFFSVFGFSVFGFVFKTHYLGYYCVVGLGLGRRNRIDDGFDIGKKDSVRMGGVWVPQFS